MIQIFTGIMGSGKTLFAVECILEAFLKGSIVATNIKLNLLHVRRYCRNRGVVFQSRQYVFLEGEMLNFPHRYLPKGTPSLPNLIVLDECAMLHPAREWQKTQKEFYHFCLMMRRQFVNMIFICQRITQIDKQFRDLYQFRWNFNNLNRALVLPVLGQFPWQILIRVQYDQTNERLSWSFVPVMLSVARCYDTFQDVVVFERGKQINVTIKRRNIFHRYLRVINRKMKGALSWK